MRLHPLPVFFGLRLLLLERSGCLQSPGGMIALASLIGERKLVGGAGKELNTQFRLHSNHWDSTLGAELLRSWRWFCSREVRDFLSRNNFSLSCTRPHNLHLHPVAVKHETIIVHSTNASQIVF